MCFIFFKCKFQSSFLFHNPSFFLFLSSLQFIFTISFLHQVFRFLSFSIVLFPFSLQCHLISSPPFLPSFCSFPPPFTLFLSLLFFIGLSYLPALPQITSSLHPLSLPSLLSISPPFLHVYLHLFPSLVCFCSPSPSPFV